MGRQGTLTDVAGIQVGQADDPQALTGCTVILCPRGAVGGVSQRGGAPGTRETDLLRPMHLVQRAHAVLLTGGSAFGLDAASGVVRYLEERRIGFDVRLVRVPIVPAAVIFDLALGRADIRPDAAMGYAACRAASPDPPREGNAGAGMGATVGKLLGLGSATKSGIGSASFEVGGGATVGALVVVNALGDVIHPASGRILAGARPVRRGPFRLGGEGPYADSLRWMRSPGGRLALRMLGGANTVIGVVATDVKLTKEQANFVAEMAQDGIARCIRPAHTLYDGDTLFALSTGNRRGDASAVGAFAAEAVAEAIQRAVLSAEPAGGLPAARQLLDPS
ncbi:MAG: P1 family peptidase [Anaerolineales bacterium]|nr:P1 family peptidase [Anaerolineales bacterium]